MSESVDDAVDWAAIDAMADPQPSPPSPTGRRIRSLVLVVVINCLIGFLVTHLGYYDSLVSLLSGDKVVDLRAHLNEQGKFPKEGSQVYLKQATLGSKGAEWSRSIGFQLGQLETRYFQVIGSVCPYEMPKENCRLFVVEVPIDHPDAARFAAYANLDVTGKLYFVDSESRFGPLIPFMREHLSLDIDGAALIAHDDRPRIDGHFFLLWSLVFGSSLLTFVLLFLAWRPPRPRRA